MGDSDAPTGLAPTALGEAIPETEAHTAWALDPDVEPRADPVRLWVSVVTLTATTKPSVKDAKPTLAAVTRQAREEGWAISSAGHYCPEHRGRTRR